MFELNQSDTKYIAAKSMFDARQKLIPICLMNLFDEEIKLPSRTVIGTAHPVEDLSVTSDSVNAEWIAKFETEVLKMVNKCNLNECEKFKLQQFLLKYPTVFALDDEALGKTHIVQHKIPTSYCQPVVRKPLRLPQTHRAEIQKHIEQMLADKTII